MKNLVVLVVLITYHQLVAGEVQEVLQNCSLSGRVSDGKYYVHVQAVRKLAI